MKRPAFSQWDRQSIIQGTLRGSALLFRLRVYQLIRDVLEAVENNKPALIQGLYFRIKRRGWVNY